MRLVDYAGQLTSEALEMPIGESRGVMFVDSMPKRYVWPHLSGPPTAPATVVLVSAAGAMGKSMAAQALACKTGGILFDVSQVRVGENTLNGALIKALGSTSYAKYVTSISDGSATLVIDGVDEALLSSGYDNYIAFLSDLVHLVASRSESASPGLVIFGRDDALDTSELVLLEARVPVARLQLAPLSQESAEELIDRILDETVSEKKLYTVHRTHREPFVQLRERVLLDLSNALQNSSGTEINWSANADFLGYPPVIAAVAERLAVSNPQTEYEAIQSNENSIANSQDRGSLLKGIVESILKREQEKVSRLVGNALPLREDDDLRRVLYAFDEQVGRILAYLNLAEPIVYSPASLPLDDRQKYDEHIKTFLADHPLVRHKSFANEVFADYVRAFSVTHPLAAVQQLGRVCRSGEVGPFFTYFLDALSARSDPADSLAEVPVAYVDHVVKSHRLSHPRGPWRLHQVGQNEGILYLNENPSQSLADGMALRVSLGSDVLTLSSPLSHCEIMVDGDLLIEERGDEIKLGAAVFIACSTISLSGQTLVIAPRRQFGREADAKPSGYGVLLATTGQIEASPNFKVRPAEHDALYVISRDKSHPWSTYLYDIARLGTPISGDLVQKLLMMTRRVLSSLQSLSNGRVGIAADILGKLTGPGLGNDVVEGLIELEVLERRGGFILLNSDRSASLGLSYATLTGDNPLLAVRAVTEALFDTTGIRRRLQGL